VKKAVLILALILLLKPILPVFEYVINYDYIAKVLCINKDKPKLHCNGKCYLMKELAKNSESENPISTNKKMSSQETVVVFFQEIYLLTIAPLYFHQTKEANSAYSNLYSYKITKSVFHPPTVIS
jgi:hypothetical protein